MTELWKLPRHERMEKRQRFNILVNQIIADTQEKNRCKNLLADCDYRLRRNTKEYNRLRKELGV